MSRRQSATSISALEIRIYNNETLLAQCPILTVANGNVTYTGTPVRTDPGLAELVCDVNHVLNGSGLVQCNSTGGWNESLGLCIRKQ